MILVDRRVGSRKLLSLIPGLPTKLTTLKFGDFALEGNGPGGKRVRVGVERKTISDLAQSITTQRLSAHQLPGIVQAYDYAWIIIEGVWRPAHDGSVEVPRRVGRKMEWMQAPGLLSYKALSKYIIGLIKAGVYTWRTGSPIETAIWLAALHEWWTGKGFDQHSSHLAVLKAGQGTVDRFDMLGNRGNVRTQASILPGLGWEGSLAAAKKWGAGSPAEMMEAGLDEWAGLKVQHKMKDGSKQWKKLGRNRARAIVRWWHTRGQK